MTEFTPYSALAGGVLIGLAAVLLLKLNGAIAGISGIFNSALRAPTRATWQILFIVGLVAGGFLFEQVTGQALNYREDLAMWQMLAGGLLVGFGTRLGSGCTSGHGVCGSARLSRRSIVATLAFMLTGFVTATLVARVTLV